MARWSADVEVNASFNVTLRAIPQPRSLSRSQRKIRNPPESIYIVSMCRHSLNDLGGTGADVRRCARVCFQLLEVRSAVRNIMNVSAWSSLDSLQVCAMFGRSYK